jgi:transposase InsO family protein
LFEVAYTDFTVLRYTGGSQKAKLMCMIGHTSKLVFGWALGKTRGADMALRAWERAENTYKEFGADLEELTLHQDRDGVYTGEEWVNKLLVEEKVSISYSMRGARGNTYMESFNGHFKNPVESIFVTSETLDELRENVADRVEYWNRNRRHESIENRTPMEFIEEEM